MPPPPRSPVEPNSFKLILLLPDEFATKQVEYVQKIAACEPRVTFGDMTKHSTPYGPMPPGKMAIEPNFITGADGSVATGSVSFPHALQVALQHGSDSRPHDGLDVGEVLREARNAPRHQDNTGQPVAG